MTTPRFCKDCGCDLHAMVAAGKIGHACSKRDERPRRDVILLIVDDLVGQLLYYDRKESEQLPLGEIEAAVAAGEITTTEIVDKFRRVLRASLPGPDENALVDTDAITAAGIDLDADGGFGKFGPAPNWDDYKDDLLDYLDERCPPQVLAVHRAWIDQHWPPAGCDGRAAFENGAEKGERGTVEMIAAWLESQPWASVTEPQPTVRAIASKIRAGAWKTPAVAASVMAAPAVVNTGEIRGRIEIRTRKFEGTPPRAVSAEELEALANDRGAAGRATAELIARWIETDGPGRPIFFNQARELAAGIRAGAWRKP